MASGYWVVTFRSVADQAGVDRYVAASLPVIRAQGGRILAAGRPAFIHEAGQQQPVAVVEFGSLEAARAAYRSPDYQATLEHLEGAAERDVRIIEGV